MWMSKVLGALVLALACCAPVLAQGGYPGVAGATPDLRDDGRHIWMAADGGGRFVYLGRGRWMEGDSRGRAFFDEVRRTPSYIELHNPRQRVNVMLLDTEAYSLPSYTSRWQPLAVGGWQ
jgi:hypothetical protein